MSTNPHHLPDNGEEIHPPEKRHHSSVTFDEESLQQIAAIYWDVNCLCQFQKIVADNPSPEDISSYENMKMHAETFVNKIVHEYLVGQGNKGSLTRCAKFIDETSWRLLAICAHSEAFQVASEILDGKDWLQLTELIKENARSLEVFARSRQLDWRGCLLLYTHHLPGLQTELSPDIDIAKEHPHHTVLLEDGHLRRPVYQDAAQTNIDSSFWNPLDFPHRTNDPSNRKSAMGSCYFCESPQNCQCTNTSMGGDLIELIEYPGKGIGIRSLAYFKEGDWIGEYTGVVGPHPCPFKETVYPLTQTAYNRWSGRWDPIATVFSHQFGNWTRFMNHSCDPPVSFQNMVVGDKLVTGIYANRDISIFEEITIDYGIEYWKTRPGLYCHCGAPHCYKPASQAVEAMEVS